MIPVFFNKAQLDFQPKYEWVLGKKIKHPETTKRAQAIFKELKKSERYEIQETPNIPMTALRGTHNYQLLTLYNTATSLEEGVTFHPSVFPQRGKSHPDPTNIYHSGYYCFDSGTPLNNRAWSAAAWSAASAFHAAKHVQSEKSEVAYALSRPPGHHATKDAFGGYCYFNNSAIAAKQLRKKGRVAIVDIDFHHGNGTQEIFYSDDQVLTISVHGSPKKHFPYFAGFPDEVGSGKGAGFNMNVVLVDGTKIGAYMKALEKTVIPMVKKFEPDYLILAAGFDTYINDPIGSFALETPDYQRIGKCFKKLGLPTVVVQEGGYYTEDLGRNVVSLLDGF